MAPQTILPLPELEGEGKPPPADEKEVNRIWKTLGGKDPWETMSAMQKHIRRSEERGALLCAYELARSGKTLFGTMVNRLVVILHEDIGVADLEAVNFVPPAIEHMRFYFQEKKDVWKLMLTNIIIVMARAKKSRLGCHLSVVCYKLDKELIPPPEIPDYALDMHTKRGMKMGRGLDHFLKEGAKLNPAANLPDPHYDEAVEYWVEKYKAKGKP